MKMHSCSVLLTACLLAVTAPFAIAADTSIGTMAKIVINLNHFPSDADKEVLTTIADSEDSSEDEMTIATAILNVEHKVHDSDKELLELIVSDDSVSSEVRELATAVLNINHKANSEDIAKLELFASTS